MHRRTRYKTRKQRSCRNRRYHHKSCKTRRSQRGGIAPITAPNILLPPSEQAKLFLYPQYDDMRYNSDFLDSRTPLLNTAVKIF